MSISIQEINFDAEDKNLFQVNDLQLKAEALRNYTLPKLKVIANELIARINIMYDINYHEHCSAVFSPHFRMSKTQRKEPVKRDYRSCGYSLTGQRKPDMWHGLDKGTGKLPEIAPANLSINLSEEGMVSYFFFNYPKGFTPETYKKFFTFLLTHLPVVNGLLHRGQFSYNFEYIDSLELEEDLAAKFENADYDIMLSTKTYHYPISSEEIENLLLSQLLIFPLFHCFIKISMGEIPNLKTYTDAISAKLASYIDHYTIEQNAPAGLSSLDPEMAELTEKANLKIKVAPGIRWQVFARDNWKCVACGRSSENDIILHTDHIIPRSKGGKDELNNYQTLCNICNIGKSNKDSTDLRKK